MSDNTAVMEAVSSLGIDVNSLDADSDLDMASIDSTEAVEEVKPEGEVKEEGEFEDDSEDPANLADEEKPVAKTAEEAAPEQPKTIKEVEEIKAQRTELEARFKLLDEQKAKMEKEFQEKYHDKLKNHDELDSWILSVEKSDPELFELLAGSFQEHQKQFSNPILNQTREELKAIKDELNGFKTTVSDEVTRTKLDAEMNQIKSTIGKEAEAAGLKPEWNKVEDVWADNPKLSLKQAFYAMYGEQIATAKASKAKLETVEKKIQGRPTVSTAGTVKASGTQVKTEISKNNFDAVKQIARQLTGRAV
jgi:hypothetical protein